MATLDFINEAKACGIGFFASVPCSILNPLFNAFVADDDINMVTATSEGEAVGIASGAWLAGVNAGVMMQNSGLGNAVNPLMSLSLPFNIPLLVMVTWRGEPGLKDEPQHLSMGEITPPLLSLMSIEGEQLAVGTTDFSDSFSNVKAALDQRRSYSLLLSKGIFSANPYESVVMNSVTLEQDADFTEVLETDSLSTRMTAIEHCLTVLPQNTAIIASTGKTGRELFTLGDQDRFFYQVGSMGCASAIGLGVALNTQLPVCVFDGDGAALMKLGNLATIGQQAPANLIHILLDNGVHDSTGGQQTASHSTDFSMVAKACGYQRVYRANSLAGLARACEDALQNPGPAFIHMNIKAGSIKNLGRPTVSMPEVAMRFRQFIQNS